MSYEGPVRSRRTRFCRQGLSNHRNSRSRDTISRDALHIRNGRLVIPTAPFGLLAVKDLAKVHRTQQRTLSNQQTTGHAQQASDKPQETSKQATQCSNSMQPTQYSRTSWVRISIVRAGALWHRGGTIPNSPAFGSPPTMVRWSVHHNHGRTHSRSETASLFRSHSTRLHRSAHVYGSEGDGEAGAIPRASHRGVPRMR